MKYLIIILAFLMTFTSQAVALDVKYDAGFLYAACEPIAGKQSYTLSDDKLFLAGFCLGTVSAVFHEVATNCYQFDELNPRANMRGVSYEAAIQGFVNYARDRPQEWSDIGTWVVARALAEYFPCKS